MSQFVHLGPFKISRIAFADLQILAAAFFFGIGFLGQRAISVDGIGPMTCNAFRFGLSTIFIVICLPLIPPDPPHDHQEEKTLTPHVIGKGSKDSTSIGLLKHFGSFALNFNIWKKTVWFWGIVLGLLNFAGSGFQQWGITKTSASKVAFIAGFDIFLTPIFALFIPTFKRNAKPRPSTWIAVGISLVGLYLISEDDVNEFEIGMGEFLSIVSTVFWTLHITYTDIATSFVDTSSMICVQLGVVTLLSAITAIIAEPNQNIFDHFFLYLPWLIFLALTEGAGFTIVALGQNFSPPSHAAIILSLGGVFTSISSYLVLGETLTHVELFGCFLMLISTIVAKLGIGSLEAKLEKQCGMIVSEIDPLKLTEPLKTKEGWEKVSVDNLESADTV